MPSIASLLSTTQLPPSTTVNLVRSQPAQAQPQSRESAIAPRRDTVGISPEAQQLLAREQSAKSPDT